MRHDACDAHPPISGKNGIWWNHTLQSETDRIGRAMVEAVSEAEPEFVVHLRLHSDL